MPARYEGFPGLMQGGYLAGVAAGPSPGPTRVQIHRPVRPGDVLRLRTSEGRRELVLDGDEGETVIMVAFNDELRVTVPAPLPPGDFEGAMARPLPWEKPFRSCVGCGDGADSLGVDLRLADDRLVDDRIVKHDVVKHGVEPCVVGSWTPAGTGPVDHRDVWTVVDCLTSWAIFVDPPAQPEGYFVTGNIAAELRRPLLGGRNYRLRSWRQRDLAPDESSFRLGSVIVGGLIEDDDGIVVLADQELARSSQFGMALAPGGGPGPLPEF